MSAVTCNETRANWWNIFYTDADGNKRYAKDMSTEELELIASLVAKGYSCGEIITNTEGE